MPNFDFIYQAKLGFKIFTNRNSINLLECGYV
jgi:hypothetical protein